MPERDDQIAAVLKAAGWSGARRIPLAGDASNRRYERLIRPDGTSAVLMDAPKERGEDVGPFLRISEVLHGWGLSAPRILAEDRDSGLLVIEDLGDDLFARHLEQSPEAELSLYEGAVEVLVRVHRAALPGGIGAYDLPMLSERAALAYDWYLKGTRGAADPRGVAAFREAIERAIAALPPAAPTLALRDYHAENLIWLPNRRGIARVGLIDYQDALATYPGYDLASLVTDARRDVSRQLRASMVEAFAGETGLGMASVEEAVAVLSTQRNLRILGVFARLAMHYGKPGYLKLIPRVWRYLETDLAHPALREVSARVLNDLPAPSASILRQLEASCQTVSP